MSVEGNPAPKSKPKFDPTINYGHVLTVVSFALAGAGAYYGMRAELQNVDQRVAKIESTLQQLANVVVPHCPPGRAADRDRATSRSAGGSPRPALTEGNSVD